MYTPAFLLSTLALASGALAQYGGDSSYGSGSTGSDSSNGASSSVAMAASSPASAGAASPSGETTVHVVKVSNKQGSLTFEPNNLQAAVGSMVQFHFYPKNHSVVQSTFDQPCQPIKNNMPAANGFFSGFMPVKPDAAMMPSYTIMVNDTKPVWYYCSQGKHCQDGMVGVINPPAANQSRTIESFTALANKAVENLSPGQPASASSSSNAASGSTSGSSGSDSYGSGNTASTVTMPLAGTNSSTGTANAATPSGSAGGQTTVPFLPGSGADAFASRMGMFGSLALAGLASLVVVGMF
ncbi:MAG: hypothetical protein Q9211_005692 [Gyalolechia sp. 1 TL-2023]